MWGLQTWRPKLPWEMGAGACDFPAIPSGFVARTSPAVGMPSSAAQVLKREVEEVSAPDGAIDGPKRRRSGLPPSAADGHRRQAVLAKWVGIIKVFSDFGAIKVKPRDIELLVQETLEPKATATLDKRGGSLMLYLAWAQRRGLDPYPVEEDIVAEYLRSSASAAATWGQAFLEALGFAGFLFRFDVENAFVPRLRGIAHGGMRRKRDTKKMEAFPVEFVCMLEEAVVAGDGDVVDLVFQGFVLWCIHARARFGDAARVAGEPILDVADGDGFLEAWAMSGAQKTGHDIRNIGLRLPLVACAYGVTGKQWAEKWLSYRRAAGLNAKVDQTLMPEVLMGNTFGAGRMPTGVGIVFMRQVFTKFGGEQAEAYGTHSCKATTLSWCAKAGLSRATRRLLGAHCNVQDRSMLEYSRDALAGPMLELSRLFAKIRAKKFMPDHTRSGRWAREEQSKEDDSVETRSGTDSSSSTSDELEGDSIDVAKAYEAVSGNAFGYPEFPEGGVWLNRRSKRFALLHKAGSESEPSAACGHTFQKVRATFLTSWPEEAIPLCTRGKCFPKR